MTKPVIAVDVDDVLAVENETVRLFANARYGHTHTADDYLTPGNYWGYWEDLQEVDSTEGARRYAEYLASGQKESLAVMDGALETLQWLKEHFTLVIVTSREAHLVEITQQWLSRHFPDIFDDIAFVAIWTGNVKGSKAAVCQELQAEYLIDDNIEHLRLASDCKIKGLLFGDYGWSKNRDLPIHATRVSDWMAVKEYFSYVAG